MIVSTEAIVLKSMKYRDTSKIVTLYTRNFGRLSVIAKGARARNNKFGSSLEPAMHVTAVLYKKEQRDLHLLSKCETGTRFRYIRGDLERLSIAMAVVELVHRVAHQEERNEGLFELLLSTLETIENATKNPRNALYFFETKLCEILGFKPDLSVCMRCNRVLDEENVGLPGIGLELHHGGVLCTSCTQHTRPVKIISPPVLRVLQRLQEMPHPDMSPSITLQPDVRNHVGETLRRYLQSHIEGLHDLKSEEVFASIV